MTQIVDMNRLLYRIEHFSISKHRNMSSNGMLNNPLIPHERLQREQGSLGTFDQVPSADKSLKARAVVDKLSKQYPEASWGFTTKEPFWLFVASILEPQTEPATASAITDKLLQQLPTVDAIANASRAEIEQILRPMSFYRQKAKSLRLTCQMLLSDYNGEVPRDMLSLVRLPGLARKGANIVLTEGFGIVDGIVVNTSVRRLAERLDLCHGKSAESIENKLMTIAPKESWPQLSKLLIAHGEAVCHIHEPACTTCPLRDICPSSEAEMDA